MAIADVGTFVMLQNAQNPSEIAPAGWVIYDGECAFCIRTSDRLRTWLEPRGYAFAPSQTDWVMRRLGLNPGDVPNELLLLVDGEPVRGGADAILALAWAIPWARPAAWIGRWRPVRALLAAGYRQVSANRHCLGGACGVRRPNPRTGWPLLAVLLLAALALKGRLVPWAFMWAICFAVFSGLKWMSWKRAKGGLLSKFGPLDAAYLLLWPGMNAREFLFEPVRADEERAPARQWVAAFAKMILGAVLLWGVAPLAYERNAFLAGWVGIIGLGMLLHFGSFHLISLFWRRLGVCARPIMDRPFISVSLSEFWSRRWNLAFRDLANPLLFGPATRRFGATRGALLAFFVSGAVHELAISFPAGAGYGLPTAYFTLQGAGLALQRSRPPRRLGPPRGPKGWLLTMLAVGPPALILFHPPFIRGVVLPFLDAIGAI